MMLYLLYVIISILMVGSVHDNLSIHCSMEQRLSLLKNKEQKLTIVMFFQVP